MKILPVYPIKFGQWYFSNLRYYALLLILFWLLASPVGLADMISCDDYVLRQNGKPIGTITVQQHPSLSVPDAMETDVYHTSILNRFGNPFAIHYNSHFVEGRHNPTPLSYHYALTVGEESVVERSGVFNKQAGKQPFSTTLFSSGKAIESLYQQHIQDGLGQSFAFRTLHLGLNPVWVDALATSEGWEAVTLTSGEQATAKRFKVENSENSRVTKTAPVYEWRNAGGKLLKASIALPVAMEMVAESVSKQEHQTALDPFHPEIIQSAIPVSVAENMTENPENTQEGFYRISWLSPQPRDLNLEAFIPSDARQGFLKDFLKNTALKSTTREGQSVVLHVVANPVHSDSSQSQAAHLQIATQNNQNRLQNTPDSQTEYLASSQWLETKDPEIRAMAKAVVAKGQSLGEKANLLSHWVYTHIDNKNYDHGFQSALQTLKNHSGDCTEHAVLLAAMARSVGIPTRIVYGLVYQAVPSELPSELPKDKKIAGQFVFHLWNEIDAAQSGTPEWIPLDATRQLVPESNLVDATHIKLGTTALNQPDDMEQLVCKVLTAMNGLHIELLAPPENPQLLLAVASGQGNGIMTVDLRSAYNTQQQPITLKSRVSQPALDLSSPDIQAGNQGFQTLLSLPGASNHFASKNSVAESALTAGLQSLAKAAGEEDASLTAWQQLAQWIEQSDNNPLKRYLLAERLMSLGLYNLSRKCFEPVHDTAPRQASLQHDYPDYTAFVADWQTLSFPKHLPDPLTEAKTVSLALQAFHDNPQARQKLQQMLAQYPDNTLLNRTLATSLAQNKTTQPRALSILEKTIQAEPQQLINYEQKADLLVDMKRYPEAMASYQQALSKLSGHSLIRAKSWYQQLQARRQLAQALAYQQKHPESGAAWVQSAEALLACGRSQDAAKAFDRAVQLDPSNTIVRFKKALSQENWLVCQMLAPKVARLASGNLDVTSFLAGYLVSARQYPQAQHLLQSALKKESFKRSQNYFKLVLLQNQIDKQRYSQNPQRLTISTALANLNTLDPVKTDEALLLQQKAQWLLLLADTSGEQAGLQALQAPVSQQLAKNPFNVPVIVLHAILHADQGHLEDAGHWIGMAEILAADNPEVLPEVLKGKALLAQHKKQWTLAMQFYQQAAKQHYFSEHEIFQYKQLSSNKPSISLTGYLSCDEALALQQLSFLAELVHRNQQFFQQAMSLTREAHPLGQDPSVQLANQLATRYQQTAGFYDLLAKTPAPKRMTTFYQQVLKLAKQHMMAMKQEFSALPNAVVQLKQSEQPKNAGVPPVESSQTKPETEPVKPTQGTANSPGQAQLIHQALQTLEQQFINQLDPVIKPLVLSNMTF
jgi:transglutaminase-like putative cysteine protease/tetratricopeptide (TPR) repeat protein